MAPFSSYVKEALIGEGYFGKVYVATNPRGRRMAFKEIPLARKSPSQINKAVAEAKMIRRFNSAFLVRSYGHFFTGNFLTIVMEYAEHGNLHVHVQRYEALYTEDRVLNAFAQLVIGLSYLHERGIIHRDLSTVNILVMSGWHMKIADFGIAKNYDARVPNNAYVRGNPVFMAPELITDKQSSYETDIWSLGIVLFYMASTKLPYYGDNMREVYRDIMINQRLSIGYEYGMYDVEELLDQTLSIYPEDRPSCESLMLCEPLASIVDLVCYEFQSKLMY